MYKYFGILVIISSSLFVSSSCESQLKRRLTSSWWSSGSNGCPSNIENCQVCNNGICTQCRDGYFFDHNNNCIECHSFDYNCRVCNNGQGCTQCNDGCNIVYDHYTGLSHCDCSNTGCNPHDDNCKVCNNNVCTQCKDGHFFDHENKCQSCYDFDHNCRVCNNGQGCTQCNDGCNSYYDHYTGLYKCDCSGGSNGGGCNPHDDNCQVCNNDVCTQCKDGHFFNRENKCISCYEFDCNCLVCNNGQGCTQCKDGCTQKFDAYVTGLYKCDCSGNNGGDGNGDCVDKITINYAERDIPTDFSRYYGDYIFNGEYDSNGLPVYRHYIYSGTAIHFKYESTYGHYYLNWVFERFEYSYLGASLDDLNDYNDPFDNQLRTWVSVTNGGATLRLRATFNDCPHKGLDLSHSY